MLKLIKFSSPACMPCRRYAPIVEKVAASRKDIFVVNVDIFEDPETASKYGVASVPFTVLESDGTVLGGFKGAVSEDQLNKIIDQYQVK